MKGKGKTEGKLHLLMPFPGWNEADALLTSSLKSPQRIRWGGAGGGISFIFKMKEQRLRKVN